MAVVIVSGLEPTNHEPLLTLEANIKQALAVRHRDAQATLKATVLFPSDLLGCRETVVVMLSDLIPNEAHTQQTRRHIADTLARLVVEYVKNQGLSRCKNVEVHVSLSQTVITSKVSVQ